MKLSPTEIYNGRKVFIIGATGFVGKVALSMLLDRFPGVGRVYVTVRARSKEESETRFWNNVITAPPFDPVRERYGAAFEDFIRDKVRVVNGDIGEDNLGFTEEDAQSVADDIDVLINSAGNVTFNPTLESALRTNVVGTQNVVAFAKRMRRPALVHISTCFVAGNRTGPVWESDPVLGYFPRRDELQGVESALRYPFPGWNEGFTTTAPLIFIALKGQQQIPVNNKLMLDITPVDQVAAVMLAVAAEAIEREPRLVYQAATGDSNPNTMERIVGMVGLYKRKHFREKETGFKLVNEIAARMESKPVTPERFDAMSTPMVNAAARKASELLDRVRPRWGGGRITDIVDRAKATVSRVEEFTRETKEAFDMFRA